MGFVPMNFCNANIAAREANAGNAFELSPPSMTILPAQPHDVSNPATDGDCLNILNFTHDLEMQCFSMSIEEDYTILFMLNIILYNSG